MSGAGISAAAAALRQYGSPYEPWDDRISTALRASVAGTIVGRYLERYENALCASSAGLADLLAALLEDDSAIHSRLEPSLGAMEWVTRSGCSDPMAVGAALALHSTAAQTSVDWYVSFRQPTRLRWGRWLLPCMSEMAVRGDSSAARVDFTGPGGVTGSLEVFAAEDNATRCEAFHKVGTYSPIVLLTGSEGPLHAWRGFDDLRRLSVQKVGPAMARSMEKAIALLADYSLTYRIWVERAIAEIVISRHKPGRSQSGSWREAPGAVQVSWSPEPLEVAEALVHEASHQYAYQVLRVGPLDDGSDREQYYSPPTGKSRPLDRILFAYHAFGNVLLFYREIVAAGFANEARVSRRIEQCLDVVSELDVPLRNSEALTWVGRSLYESLSDRVASGASVG